MNNKVEHGLVVKIINPENIHEQQNFLFIGLEHKPTKEVIDFFYGELKNEPELAIIDSISGEVLYYDFTIEVATLDEIHYYSEQSLDNDLNVKQKNV